jgi:hypothetical protein
MKRESGHYWVKITLSDGVKLSNWIIAAYNASKDYFIINNTKIYPIDIKEIDENRIVYDSELRGKNLQLIDHNKELTKINNNLRKIVEELKSDHSKYVNTSLEIVNKLIEENKDLKNKYDEALRQVDNYASILSNNNLL